MRTTSMNSKKMITLGALCATLALATMSCRTTRGPVDKGTEAAARVVMPPAQEAELGARLREDLSEELTFHPNAAVQSYIDQLGGQVVDEAQGDLDPEIQPTFHVVQDPEQVNAFAIPGGHIYVFSGLLLEAETEAEVVGVLGHELAHVTERHVAERLVANYGFELIQKLALGQNPGKLKEIATTLATQSYLLKYGRDQEREADDVGLAYMIQARYDPQGLVAFFRTLADKPHPPTFLSSHPHPSDRIDSIQAQIQGMKDIPERTGREDYQAMYPRFRVGDQQVNLMITPPLR